MHAVITAHRTILVRNNIYVLLHIYNIQYKNIIMAIVMHCPTYVIAVPVLVQKNTILVQTRILQATFFVLTQQDGSSSSSNF
jgi:hypothetical protein